MQVKIYDRLMALVIVLFLAGILLVNLSEMNKQGNRNQLYNVEANRLIEIYNNNGSLTESDLDWCESIDGMQLLDTDNGSMNDTQDFFDGSGYIIRPLYQDGVLKGYVKFTFSEQQPASALVFSWQNGVLVTAMVLVTALMLYIRAEIINPVQMFIDLPEALAKGDLTIPVRVQKSRFFGKFLWSLDMLREKLLAERQRALRLEKEKAQFALSVSHDIKTPLSAIVLYSGALRSGLYSDREKQDELCVKIEQRALEIQDLIQKFQHSVSEDIADLPVEDSEFYSDDLIRRIKEAYQWRTQLTGAEFCIKQLPNCLIKGDGERAYETLCNLLENAIKYGDGRSIIIEMKREENCLLITVVNTGDTPLPSEMIHIFDSFWRGSNAGGKQGSGLGLFIARKLCVKMGGDAFASADNNEMRVTLVFQLA